MNVSLPLVAIATGILVGCQGLLLVVDERIYHRRRGLGPWELWGHPIDTISVLIPVLIAATTLPSPTSLAAFAGTSLFSSLLVTKDEAVHARACTATEHWLHAVMFVIHAPILIGVGLCWWLGAPSSVFQLYSLALTVAVLVQLIQAYRSTKGNVMGKTPVNNAFYSELGDRWYHDDTHAVALLRREADVKLDYIRRVCAEKNLTSARILDLGAGAGLLANPLAALGHQVTAVDSSQPSLDVAARHAPARNAPRLICRDVRKLDDDLGKFDVVMLLDFLEHVENPAEIVATSARFLAPGGVLVFHTFNRTPLAWLMAIKALEIFTRQCPKDVHVYHLFIKPKELAEMLRKAGLQMKDLHGIRPVLNAALFRSGLYRRLHPQMRFKLTSLKGAGYIGYALKA